LAFDSREYLKLAPLLDQARRVTVLTHIHPDGDGVGSGVALARWLRRRGLDGRFIPTQPLTSSLRFLGGGEEVTVYTRAGCSAFIRDSDLLITVDNGAVSRLGPLEEDVRASRGTRVCVDHHLTRDPFWQINLVDEAACATGEMVHDLIVALGGKVDHAIAEGLYVAIVTDTGGFRYAKTSARIHRMVAEFLDLGVRPHEISGNLHERNSRAALCLLARALERARFSARGRLAWVDLPGDLLGSCGAETEDTSEIINHLLSVEGVDVAVLLREEPDGRTKISWRSKPALDVHALARAHGGGGHRNAAGAVIAEPLASCTTRVVGEAEALLG
jgi:phosphoesterase RecJ-like protein